MLGRLMLSFTCFVGDHWLLFAESSASDLAACLLLPQHWVLSQ
jgi:hypothetical protein